MTRMRIEEVSLARIRMRPKDKIYCTKVSCDWQEIIDALSENPDNPDYQFVYTPVDVNCVSENGNRAVFSDTCYFSIVDGKHRYYCLKSIGARTIKVKFAWHDEKVEIQEMREQRKAYRDWKGHKCQNCKNLRTLKKGRRILVNENEKLCFFQCKTKGNLMDRDDAFRINDCKDFNPK